MKVLVIGAGVAGLSTAHFLSATGVNVCILEARNRIGGRIHTLRDPAVSVPIELGAEFIHGRPDEIFAIARAAGLATTEVSGSHRFVQEGKLSQRRDIWSGVDAIFARMADVSVPDQTFSQFLTLVSSGQEAQAWAKSYVEGFNAARADLISIRSLIQDEQASQAIEGDRMFRVSEGYDRVAQWLWQQCALHTVALRLETVVKSVRWRKGKVELTAHSSGSSGTLSFSADRAIITVPIGVLKAPDDAQGAIRFEPELPRIRSALERLEMGHAIRITLAFRSSFWRKHPQVSQAGFIHSDDEWLPTWWTSISARLPILTAWAGGPKAEKFLGLHDQEVAERAIGSLSGILGANRKDVANHIEHCYTHHWSDDPFARGAYSYARVGGIEARRVLATPVEDTLYFAGEATNTSGHSATVHGAIAAGRCAARDILAT